MEKEVQAQEQPKVEVPKSLTCAVLVSVFDGEAAVRVDAGVAKAEKSRMTVLRELIPLTADTEIKAACKAYVDQWKQSEGFPKGGNRKLFPRVMAAETRMSEVRLMAGAVKHCGLDISTLGYHSAVQAARITLKVKGLRPDGSPGKSKEQREREALARSEKAIAKAVGDKAAKQAIELDRTLTDDERVALTREADKLHVEATSLDLARGIVVKYGVTVAEQIAALIPSCIQEALAKGIKQGDNLKQAKELMAEARQAVQH